MSKKISNEEFIKLSKDKFGDLIDHSKTQLIGYLTKVTLYCREHGSFSVMPSTHLNSKHGCTKCGLEAAPKIRAEIKKATFVQDAFNTHADIYDYSLVKYLTTKDKVEIVCREHGSFWQTPQKHLSGQGCPACAKFGYNTSREGTFYVLYNGSVTKVGITHQAVEERIRQINRSKKTEKFKLKFSVDCVDGKLPREFENICLNHLRNNYEQVDEVFDGSTECFKNVNMQEFIRFVFSLVEAGRV